MTVGGFAIGAYWAGMRFGNHFCSDIEKYCVELYAKRFPDSVQLGDITKIDFEKLKNDYPGEWIITGGFPCQDISIAGKGAGIEGTRSGLWFEYWRAIRMLRPRFAIIENVGAITIRGLDAVLGSLAEIGYDAEWQDIRAEDMGAPHKRERIWIVSYPGHDARSSEQKQQTTGLAGNNQKISNSEIKRSLRGELAQTNVNQKTRKKRGNRSFQRWAAEPSMGCLVDGLPAGLDRFEGRLSNKSYKRVDQLKGLGNSIVPQIAELLFREIKELI